MRGSGGWDLASYGTARASPCIRPATMRGQSAATICVAPTSTNPAQAHPGGDWSIACRYGHSGCTRPSAWGGGRQPGRVGEDAWGHGHHGEILHKQPVISIWDTRAWISLRTPTGNLMISTRYSMPQNQASRLTSCNIRQRNRDKMVCPQVRPLNLWMDARLL
jgi:hypothetical protein